MNKINAFLIGAQKAGTTSLYDWLRQHPDIYAPLEVKDYHFFTEDKYYNKGSGHINKFYKNANTKVILHAGVQYMFFHDIAAKRIFDYNPDAKIIICLREPVARAISAYKYMVQTFNEKNSFEDSLLVEKHNKLEGYHNLANKTYIAHGKYLEQINGFLKYFPKRQIYFLLFEEIINEQFQHSELQGLLKFLGVNDKLKFNFTKLNESENSSIRIILRIISMLKIFKHLIPFTMRRRIFKQLKKIKLSKKKITFDIPKEVNDIIIHNYIKEIDNLSIITKKNLKKIWNLQQS